MKNARLHSPSWWLHRCRVPEDESNDLLMDVFGALRWLHLVHYVHTWRFELGARQEFKGVSGLLPVFVPTLPPQTHTLKHQDCWGFGFSVLSKDTSSELGEPDGEFLEFGGLISCIQLVKSHGKYLERGGPIKIIWKVIKTFCLSYSKQSSLIFRCQFRQIATARGFV